MTGITNKGRGAGRGNVRKSTGGDRGHGGHRTNKPTKVGLCKELEGSIFDFGECSSADLIQTTQIKIAQYIGSQYRGDIMRELETKTEFVVPAPIFPHTATARQPAYKAMVRAKLNNNLATLMRRKARAEVQLGMLTNMPDDSQERAVLEDTINEIESNIVKHEYELLAPVKVPLDEMEKAEWRTTEKQQAEHANKHELNRQKAFAIILGQCTQRLQDKMKDDAQWEHVNKNHKPLELYALIERVVLRQTGDEYQGANIVDNLLSVLTIRQANNISNAQWYERFNTRVEVAESVGIRFDIFACMLHRKERMGLL
jgi:hypothetical protein